MLLSHADILIHDEIGWSVLHGGYLGIEGDTIRYVGAKRPDEQYGEEKNLSGHLLMSGLYNTHTHTPMTLLRGVGSGLPLHRWLHEAILPVEARMNEQDISAGTRLALMEMLASGIVSFTDMYDFAHITAAEVVNAGMKANMNRPLLGFDSTEPYGKNAHAIASLAFFKEYNGWGGGKIIADFAIHAEYTSFEGIVRPYAEDCRRAGAHMHLHLSETRKEHEECKARHGGRTPTEWFRDLGVLDNPTTAAHCVAVEPQDIEILREKGVTCVHNPTSNMKLGSGFMPARALLDAGVNVALGTDGTASNNNLNLFEEMHLAALIHCGYLEDPTAMQAGEVLCMATINGAAAQGRTNCGKLAAGYKADIIAVDLSGPHMRPVLDLPALLVYSAQAADVRMTMVDGKILYENGEFLTIDRERTERDVQASVERLFAK